MKQVVVVIVLLFFMFGTQVLAEDNHKPLGKEEISFKAGPTGPSEELALAWVETVVYPRIVQNDGKLSLFARMTAKVSKVTVDFDFNADELELVSTDGMSWTCFYDLNPEVLNGVHVATFKITGKNQKSIVRSLDFFVNQNLAEEINSQARQLITEKEKGWPLKVSAREVYLADSDGKLKGVHSFRRLTQFDRVVGLYKEPWYRVRFNDGTEGWVLASQVEEPAVDFYKQGYGYFIKGEYERAAFYYNKALLVDADFHKARYWLAKSYYKWGKDYLAANELAALLNKNPGDRDVANLATILSQKYYEKARAEYTAQKYQQAVIAYQQVIRLKPSCVTAQIELGESYKKLGFDTRAREVWIEAFRVDPENAQVKLLLGMSEGQLTEEMQKQEEAASAVLVDKKIARGAAPAKELKKEEKAVAVSDSLNLVKNCKTTKGTSVVMALKEVVNLTKSGGTLIREKGWTVHPAGSNIVVTFVCEQDRSGSGNKFVAESFSWRVDQATQQIVPHNENAKLLMSSW